MRLVESVKAALVEHQIQYEEKTAAVIDSEAADWYESSLLSILLVRHYSHGYVTLVVYDGSSSDELPSVTMIGGEDWSSLRNILQAVVVSS